MKSETAIGIVVLLIALAGGWYLFSHRSTPEVLPDVSEEEEVLEVVEAFGTKLQFVSLLSPESERKADMELYYGPYVAPELLATWFPEGAESIGRYSSSPWPDSVEVVSVTESGSGYAVEANVLEVANTDEGVMPAAVYPISLHLEKRGNLWVIVSLEKGAYSQLPQRVTVNGFWECVPIKAGFPKTEECLTGIAVDQSDGHVVVDTALMSRAPVEYDPGTKVQVKGIMTPSTYLSSDHWQKYDIDGIISATTIEEL